MVICLALSPVCLSELMVLLQKHEAASFKMLILGPTSEPQNQTWGRRLHQAQESAF